MYCQLGEEIIPKRKRCLSRQMDSFRRRKRKEKLIETFGSCCHYCKGQFTYETLTLDHKKGWKELKGKPDNSFENTVLACRRCNSFKGEINYELFIELIEDLNLDELTCKQFLNIARPKLDLINKHNEANKNRQVFTDEELHQMPLFEVKALASTIELEIKEIKQNFKTMIVFNSRTKELREYSRRLNNVLNSRYQTEGRIPKLSDRIRQQHFYADMNRKMLDLPDTCLTLRRILR